MPSKFQSKGSKISQITKRKIIPLFCLCSCASRRTKDSTEPPLQRSMTIQAETGPGLCCVFQVRFCPRDLKGLACLGQAWWAALNILVVILQWERDRSAFDHATKLPSNQALKVMMAGCLKQAGGNKLILAVGSCSVSENFYVHITHWQT